MSRTSVLKRPQPSATLPRNAFDRSFRSNFNASAGMLLPAFVKDVKKNDHIELDLQSFTRSQLVNTAAFARVSENYEFYFVPYKLLWSYWDYFYTNTQDYPSSLMNGAGWSSSAIASPVMPTNVPSIPSATLHAALTGTNASALDPMGYSRLQGANRLLDLLGYGSQVASLADNNGWSMNPFRILAYQKVYYDHYRNSAYEQGSPAHWNCDFAGGNTPSITNTAALADWFTLRYRNYRNDYLQNLYPALNYVSTAPNGSQWVIPSSVVGLQTAPNISVSAVSGSGVTFVGGAANYNNAQVTTVQNIRAAFALDKLARSSAYAPKHIRDQYQARFGYSSPDDDDSMSKFIGSFQNEIVFQEVTQTTNTASEGSSNLGEIGGKGLSVASHGHKIEYQCQHDGVIIGMYSLLPRSEYDSMRIDRFNMKLSREDYFQPEFMDLGLQPVYNKEFYFGGSQGATVDNLVLGYQPRYQEYKLSVDENHGEFRANQSLSPWVSHKNQNYEQSGTAGVPYTYFKVDPAILDPVFAVNYDGTQKTDQFFTTAYFNFRVNSNMSIHGVPRL